jgi:hypothetical protein
MRLRRRREDNMMYITKTGHEENGWIKMVQDQVQ